MYPADVQQFADKHGLDVKPIQTYHYRLVDSLGRNILDVYFKRQKGRIVRNVVYQCKTQTYSVAKNTNDLLKLL